MFGKKKDYDTFVIRKMQGHDLYGEYEKETEANKELKEKFVQLWNHNIPGLEEYYEETESHNWDKKEKRFILRGYNSNYEYYLKSELDALGFVPLKESYQNFIGVLDVKYYHIYHGDYYVSPEDLKKIKKAVETEQKPLVLKGTDWPYWFKVEGKLIPSTTSSWFNFLYKEHKIVTEKMLEAYTGPDKYEEHKNECK